LLNAIQTDGLDVVDQ